MQAVMYNVRSGSHEHFANIPIAPSSCVAYLSELTDYRTTSLAMSLLLNFPREWMDLAHRCMRIAVHRSGLVAVPYLVRLLPFRQPEDMPQICDEVSDSL